MVRQDKQQLGRYLPDLIRHGAGLGTCAAVTIVTWVLDKFVTADWWQHPTTTFYAIVISIGLAITQYKMWQASDKKRKELEGWARQASLSASLDMKFGPCSNYTGDEQLNHATAYFEELEDEIGKGKFARAFEVFSFREPFVKILRQQFGGGYGFDLWHSRLVRLVSVVDQHIRSQDEEDD